jgi:hypothetical protein
MKAYDDGEMSYNTVVQRFVLKEKYVLEKLAINMNTRLKKKGGTTPQNLIATVLEHASAAIYGYIYAYNFNNAAQERAIRLIPSARELVKRAMGQQLVYLLSVGDMGRSTDPNKRKIIIDEYARMTLAQTLPELGIPLTYQGRFPVLKEPVRAIRNTEESED